MCIGSSPNIPAPPPPPQAPKTPDASGLIDAARRRQTTGGGYGTLLTGSGALSSTGTTTGRSTLLGG